MICTECNGSGESVYYVEIDRDEKIVTMKQRKCTCRTCNGSGKQPMIKVDHIRSMSDEELVRWIYGDTRHSDVACNYCEYNKNSSCNGTQCQDVTDAEIIMKWLQQPAEE